MVYGPVASRRFGSSLGINLSGPGKYCSFDCPYCFRGTRSGRPDHEAFLRNLPDPEAVVKAVKIRLANADAAGIEDWTVAGNAEPTDHPGFPYLVDALTALRNETFPNVRISVLTNGMGIVPRLNPAHESVRMALAAVDRACLKVDSGRERTWLKLARPYAHTGFREWRAAVEGIPGIIIQTMLVNGRIDNTTPAELDALAQCYHRLKPAAVQVLTINKKPLDDELIPVPKGRLVKIRMRLEQITYDRMQGDPTCIPISSTCWQGKTGDASMRR